MNKKEKRTPVSELGKYGLINHIIKDIKPTAGSTVLNAGDDAAAIKNEAQLTLVTTDLLLEGIHFNLVYTPLKHLGYKSVIRGISDIYAMNGTPQQVLIGVGFSSRFFVEDVDEIYAGISAACKRYGVDLAGGDMASSLTGLTISVTATGSVDPGKMVKRSGARANDLICVTGDLGASYMGLQLLERERKLFEKSGSVKPELAGYEYIIGRQLKPEFPKNVVEQLNKEGLLPTSMTDVSEGLASDLLQLCSASGTGCRIFQDKIPVDSETIRMAEEFRIDPLIPVLNGGEDYELLFTVPLEDFEWVKNRVSAKIIGHMTAADYGRCVVTEDGEEIELAAQGWKT